MALVDETLEKALSIFHSIKKDLIPDLEIPSTFVDTKFKWTLEPKGKTPPTKVVLASMKTFPGQGKSDGWMGLYFFLKDPTLEFVDSVKNYHQPLPTNTSLNHYDPVTKMFVFGWV